MINPTKNNIIDLRVGRRIKELRLSVGMAQSDVAEKLDITFQQLQKYESGKNRISASKLYLLSLLFKKDVQFFFEGIEEVSADKVVENVSMNYITKTDNSSQKLLRLFLSIKDPPIRRQLLRLVRALSAEKLDT